MLAGKRMIELRLRKQELRMEGRQACRELRARADRWTGGLRQAKIGFELAFSLAMIAREWFRSAAASAESQSKPKRSLLRLGLKIWRMIRLARWVQDFVLAKRAGS